MQQESPDDMVGKLVRVADCSSLEHGQPRDGCVCHLKGRTVRIYKRYGGNLYSLWWKTVRVQHKEIELLPRQGVMTGVLAWIQN